MAKQADSVAGSAVQPGAMCFTSLNPSVLVWKMGMIPVFPHR